MMRPVDKLLKLLPVAMNCDPVHTIELTAPFPDTSKGVPVRAFQEPPDATRPPEGHTAVLYARVYRPDPPATHVR